MKRKIPHLASKRPLGPPLREPARDHGQSCSLANLCRELRTHEETLWEHAESYRALVEHSPDAIDRFDRNFTHLYVNPAGARLHGKDAEEIIGKTIEQTAVSEPRRAVWEKRITDVFETGQSIELEEQLLTAYGLRVFNSRCVPEFAADGMVSTVLVVSRDVTDHRRAEDEVRKAKDELEKRVRERTAELSVAVDALQEEVAMRLGAEEGLRHRTEQLRALAAELTLAEQRERRRMAQVLHDHLQQLLVGARMRIGALRHAPLEPLRKAALEADKLLAECIGTSRSLTCELSPPVLHDGGLVEAMEWLSQWVGQKYGLNVQIRAQGPNVCETQDIKVLLYQSVRELLFNVVKHAKVKTAQVCVDRSPAGIKITVADRGRGFQLGKLRAHGAREGGFGLFSIRERLELLGGGLEIKSAPGKGSEFTLQVPLLCSLEGRYQPAQPAQPARPAQATGG
jgi:PAS domain S-box-containing protein